MKNRIFVGRAWVNKTEDGSKYINAKLDNSIQSGESEFSLESITLNVTDDNGNKKRIQIRRDTDLQMFKNDKRNKDDADLRLSFAKGEQEQEDELLNF